MADGDRVLTRPLAEPAAPGQERTSPAASESLGSRPAVAGVLLLLVYVALSFLNHPSGYLGTDTGGKVATLEAMVARGDLVPDVGYWAEEWDPEGTLHPLWYTSRIGDKWVNVTTLPALYLALPLYDLGGYRVALLVPMLGAVAAAFAAREIARRTSGGDGWLAFWLTGLASPMVIYALDFWEHTLGVALMAWGIVAFMAVLDGLQTARLAAVAGAGGLAFGLAATMRTESLVYGAVTVALACMVLLIRKKALLAPLVAGGASALGVALPVLGNNVLEGAVLGAAARSARAFGTVAGASATNDSRFAEAALTGLSLHPVLSGVSFVLGTAVLVLLVFVARKAASPVSDRGFVLIGCGGLLVLYVLRFVDGPGFVPGLVAATPLAAAGLAFGWRSVAARFPIAVALAALPVVWALQYTGGAAPQWGGRYILTSGLILAAVGAASLHRMVPVAQLTFVCLALGVSAFGVTWLSERSHGVARVGRHLVALPEPVVVSDIEHLPRELGAHHLEKLFLTAPDARDRRRAGDVVREAGHDSFAFVQLAAFAPVEDIRGYEMVGEHRVTLFTGVDLRVARFEAADG